VKRETRRKRRKEDKILCGACEKRNKKKAKFVAPTSSDCAF
jgi:hypothetical protein